MIHQLHVHRVFSAQDNEWVCDAHISKNSEKHNSGYAVCLVINSHHYFFDVGCTPDDYALNGIVRFVEETCDVLHNIIDGNSAGLVIANISQWILSQIGQSVEYSLWAGYITANHQYISMSNLVLNKQSGAYNHSENLRVYLCENNRRIQCLNSKALFSCLRSNYEVPIYQTLMACEFELYVEAALKSRMGIESGVEDEYEYAAMTGSTRMLDRLKGLSNQRLLFGNSGLSRRGFR